MGRAAAAEDELERRDGDEDAAGALPVSMERRPPARRLLGAGSARLGASVLPRVRPSVRPNRAALCCSGPGRAAAARDNK